MLLHWLVVLILMVLRVGIAVSLTVVDLLILNVVLLIVVNRVMMFVFALTAVVLLVLMAVALLALVVGYPGDARKWCRFPGGRRGWVGANVMNIVSVDLFNIFSVGVVHGEHMGSP